jgi:two-component system response regulator HydG
MSYPWYGNLRELNNIVKRTTLLSEGSVVEAKALPFELLNHGHVMFADEPTSFEPSNPMAHVNSKSHSLETKTNVNDLKAAAQEAEFETIMNALQQTNFNKSKAARYLNIDRKTLYNKMKALNM